MLHMQISEIIEKISAESKLSEKEIKELIKRKCDSHKGLVSEEGAAYIIAHDLTNIAQILLSTLESISSSNKNDIQADNEMKILFSQVERMSELLEEVRSSVQDDE